MNEGLPIPFLGHDAWTATAPAALALRFRCPLIPVRVERLSGVRFRITVDPPMALPDTGDRQTDIRLLLTRMTAMLEGWIRERPEQWFWVHRRWRSEEHTSALQSLMRISYAVFCLTKKNNTS